MWQPSEHHSFQVFIMSNMSSKHAYMLLLGLSCLCTTWRYAAAHGQMILPKSRNFIAYLGAREWCPHCLNAGGAAKVSGGQAWPGGRHGYCGDAYDVTKWDVPGPLVNSYVEGQVINVDIMKTEDHLGRFDMTICDINAKPGDGKCTQLNRADGKGKYWYLPFLANWSGGNRGVEKPAYSDGSFGWYLMPAVTTVMGCNMTDIPCDHYNDIVIYRTRWQLPPGFTCTHCKLQWHYLTAQSCWPPCPIKNKDEVTCKNAQAYETCGQPKAQYPEEFWNCADVSVLSKANAGATDPGTANKAAWENQVSVSYAPYGVPRTYQLTGLEWSVMELPRPLDSVAPGRL